MNTIETIEIKWSVSKGRDTYGYNICSLWSRGKKLTSCSGGGYDMVGTCFADWLELDYLDRLKKLNSDDFYGLSFYKPLKSGKGRYLKRYSKGCAIRLDGACGINSVFNVAQAIGINCKLVSNSTNLHVYIYTDKRKG